MRVVDGTSEPERWLTREELAQALNLSVRTIDRMVADQQIPSVTWGRRMRRFRLSLVIRALEMGPGTTAKEAA